jgi:hypothetical protein
VGLIQRGYASAIDPNSARWVEATNPDAWRYLGAFDTVTLRSTVARRSETRFFPAAEQAECIPSPAIANGNYRQGARSEECPTLTEDSVEYLYSVALNEAFRGWIYEAHMAAIDRENALPVPSFEVSAPARGSGVTEGAIFQFTSATTGAVVLAVRVIDNAAEPDIESFARQLARQGVEEYWAVDARTGQTTIFSRRREDRYSRQRSAPSSHNLETAHLPGLRLRLDQLDLEAASAIEFSIR